LTRLPGRASSKKARASWAWLLVLGHSAWPGNAHAQACCAGSAAVTPARLTLHEDALYGVQTKALWLSGSFDDERRYLPSPNGASEVDFEQDLFGAVRFLERGQLALMVPIVETRREAHQKVETGGGLGDVNESFRYDFVLAGQSRTIPGIALLAGLTLPTGKPADSSSKALATDATGTGTFQGTLGLALEQTYGSWLFNATGLVSQHTARSAHGVHATLGGQASLLGACAYALPGGAALALLLSYSVQGHARIDGVEAAGSARRQSSISAAGLLPLGDAWRLQGSLQLNPTWNGFGQNSPAGPGLTLGIVRSWT
jgi:hypothetical protein